MELTDSLNEFAPVARVFDALSIDYQIGGSVASSVHGFPRGTHDIDVEADIRAEHVANIVKELEAHYLVSKEMIEDALRYQSAFNLIPLDSISKIDIFIRKDRPFDQEAAKRKQKGIFLEDGTEFPYFIDSAEDTILRKLEWYRMGNEVSDQKWTDILAVLKAQVFDLDFEYLQKWASELKVADLLERALDESGLKES